jgi:hypothetical protein
MKYRDSDTTIRGDAESIVEFQPQDDAATARAPGVRASTRH